MLATPSRKIYFRFADNAEGYQQVLIDNGAFVVQCTPDRWWTNIGDIANFKLEYVIPSSQSLPLVIRMNLRDYEPKLKYHLNKIRDLTGKEFQFVSSYDLVLEKTVPVQPAAKDRLGEILYDNYMSNVASLYEMI